MSVRTEPAPDRDLFGHAPKGRPDWSHRRGEPRLFAVLWLVYLMSATVVMLAMIGAARALSPSVTRPAATMLMVVCMVGVCVLWPALRLSQLAPRRAARSVAADLPVVLVPVCALIVPQGFWFLSDWSWGVVVALCGFFAAWGLVVGALLAIALGTVGRGDADAPPGIGRTAWTLGFVVLVVAAPVLVGLGVFGGPEASGVHAARPGWLFSPVTAVMDLVRDRSAGGVAARIGVNHARALGYTFVAAGGLWTVVMVLGLVRSWRDA
ncbi:MAG: hypothetical protein DHS20C14_15810 [Phycisphaeraceae bacterium]|nr:MAG: hypothetical protein DHS20C14_15810 [Phycisphaeraceae bacterium]